MTRTRCCWHGMLKVKATVTSVSKRMEALISNVHTTHKDSKLLMRTSTDVLFVIGLVPWTLIKFSNCGPSAVQKAQKMEMKERKGSSRMPVNKG